MGIRIWNKPNHRPQIKAIRHENFLVVNPLQMETEKASIDKLTAISNSSMKDISFVLCGKNKINLAVMEKNPTFATNISNLTMKKTLLLMLTLLLAVGGFAQDKQKKAKKEK